MSGSSLRDKSDLRFSPQVGAWCNLIGLEISLETIPDDSPEARLNPCNTRVPDYTRVVFTVVKKTPNWLTFHKARCLAVR